MLPKFQRPQSRSLAELATIFYSSLKTEKALYTCFLLVALGFVLAARTRFFRTTN